jgi:hypothetical protein
MSVIVILVQTFTSLSTSVCWMDRFLDIGTQDFGIDEVRKEKELGLMAHLSQ